MDIILTNWFFWEQIENIIYIILFYIDITICPFNFSDNNKYHGEVV